MSAETLPLATQPFPSFEGIVFPRDYAVEIVHDGDVIPLAGRDLLVIQIPDHAVGSLAFLDGRERILSPATSSCRRARRCAAAWRTGRGCWKS